MAQMAQMAGGLRRAFGVLSAMSHPGGDVPSRDSAGDGLRFWDTW